MGSEADRTRKNGRGVYCAPCACGRIARLTSCAGPLAMVRLARRRRAFRNREQRRRARRAGRACEAAARHGRRRRDPRALRGGCAPARISTRQKATSGAEPQGTKNGRDSSRPHAPQPPRPDTAWIARSRSVQAGEDRLSAPKPCASTEIDALARERGHRQRTALGKFQVRSNGAGRERRARASRGRMCATRWDSAGRSARGADASGNVRERHGLLFARAQVLERHHALREFLRT